MSIVGKILDIFGPGGNNKFYARDFRNAYTFRPDQNPPRQKFQGYVSFVVNRALYGDSFYGSSINSEFRLRLGSLVRTATLPEIEFKTETKNSYNKKHIVNTGVEYQPVDIKVFDTINNEWLMMFMKYFSYHYMNPRNKQFGDRDVGSNPYATSPMMVNSEFGKKAEDDTGSRWDSNAFGYNVNELANFFERIDYVLYHGNKGVQYSLINPVLTRFRTGEIDYASSDVMEFDMTFEYEYFTIYNQVNFGLSEFDVARFENASGFTGPAFVPFNTPVLLAERNLEFMGGNTNAYSYNRTSQVDIDNILRPADGTGEPGERADTGLTEPPITDSEVAGGVQSEEGATQQIVVTATRTRLPSIYGRRATFATPVEKNKSFIGGLLGNIADNALTAAIHGTSIKNAVINTAVGGVTQGIVDAVRPAVRGVRNRPSASDETSTASTSERPPVTPGGTI